MIQLSGPGATRTGAGNDFEVLTLALCKPLIRETETTFDTLIQSLLDAVHQWTSQLTGGRILKLNATPYVGVFSGRGTLRLKLPQWPVGVFTSLEEGMFTADGTWTALQTYDTSYYHVDKANGLVHALQGVWPEGYNNLRATWTAGYAAGQVPGFILQGLAEWVGVLKKRALGKSWDVLTETLLNENRSFKMSDLPSLTQKMILQLRPTAVMVYG